MKHTSSKRKLIIVLCLLLFVVGGILYTKQKILSRNTLRSLVVDTIHGDSTASLVLSQTYPAAHDVLTSLSGVSSEIAELLGATTKKTYLVALMNTSEKKPDGGFFGSYAIVSLDKENYTIDFFDSYYPQTILDTKHPLPSRFENIFQINSIGFLGANMIGFTPIDGETIHTLYNRTFKTQLDGVIFVKYDLFEALIPDFTTLSYKREFLNATVDKIRGENTGNKKEQYFADTRSLVSEKNFVHIVDTFLTQISTLLDTGYIRVYLPKSSHEMQQRLTQHHMIQNYSPTTVFAYDYNLGFNKIDKFVTKKIDLLHEGKLMQSVEGEMVSVDTRVPGTYEMYITYEGNVPATYTSYIQELATTYAVTLDQREHTILSLDPQRDNRGVVYLPPFATNIMIDGQTIEQKQFQTPFARALTYECITKGATFRKTVHITFSIL